MNDWAIEYIAGISHKYNPGLSLRCNVKVKCLHCKCLQWRLAQAHVSLIAGTTWSSYRCNHDCVVLFTTTRCQPLSPAHRSSSIHPHRIVRPSVDLTDINPSLSAFFFSGFHEKSGVFRVAGFTSSLLSQIADLHIASVMRLVTRFTGSNCLPGFHCTAW